jgi:ubiquinone/menaquinone biosynthesis C-methylase UbiE
MVDYQKMDPDFYESKLASMNLFQSWFHGSRNEVVEKFVLKYYKEGQLIADLGCGNVLWNSRSLPVVGVDINDDFLTYDLTKGKIIKKVVCTLDDIKLEDGTADIVVISEVIEHLPDLDRHISEIYRILKPGGIVISSVPYDTNFSLWKPLFAVQCFIQGQIFKDKYYQEKCGHINHFSKSSIAGLFSRHKFDIVEQYNHYLFTIFTIARKIN